jgi:parvulin-like peptidyl-prolyl isomerase
MLNHALTKVKKAKFLFQGGLAILLLGLLFACSEDRDDNAVALVNGKRIYYSDIQRNFHTQPLHRKGDTRGQAMQQQLERAITEKLLASAAESSRMDTSYFYRERLAWYRQQQLRDLYFARQREKRIKVTAADSYRGFIHMGREVEVRHLFFRDSLEAALALDSIQSGRSDFARVARRVFQSPRLRNSGGFLGICRFGELEEELENVAFSLNAGELADTVVATQFGYHLVKTETITINMLPTREAFARLRPEVEDKIRRRRFRRIRQAIVDSLVTATPVEIRIPSYERLAQLTSRHIEERPAAPLPLPPLWQREISAIADADLPLQQQPLVFIGPEVWTVGDFLQRLRRMPPEERPSIATPEALCTTIRDLALTEIVAAAATAAGDDQLPVYRARIEHFSDALLAQQYRFFLAGTSPADSSAVVNAYREKHGGEAEIDSEMFTYLRNQHSQQVVQQHYRNTLDSLRQRADIAIDEERFRTAIGNPEAIIARNPTPLIMRRR